LYVFEHEGFGQGNGFADAGCAMGKGKEPCIAVVGVDVVGVCNGVELETEPGKGLDAREFVGVVSKLGDKQLNFRCS
jgi:hypothetical protein